MDVWVAVAGQYDATVVGVYTTPDEAEQYIRETYPNVTRHPQVDGETYIRFTWEVWGLRGAYNEVPARPNRIQQGGVMLYPLSVDQPALVPHEGIDSAHGESLPKPSGLNEFGDPE